MRLLVLLAGLLAEQPDQPVPSDLPAASTFAGGNPTGHLRPTRRQELVAGGVAGGAGLADPLERVRALLAVVVANAPAPAAAPAA